MDTAPGEPLHRGQCVCEFYHAERHHQGLDGQLIEPCLGDVEGEGDIVCRKRLGGMLRFYHREAA
jgi:hypothetical protein